MSKERKIFFVVTSGAQDTERHYYDTIETKRSIEEASQFLEPKEIKQLKVNFHGQPYVVWGAVPGSGNMRNWESMEPGDYVMIYRAGKIILAAEVAMKVRSPRLARYFWKEDKKGKTWELIYFLINEVKVNVPQEELNKYLGYKEDYKPRGFNAIKQEKVDALLSQYGDLISFLQRIERGEKPEEIEVEKRQIIEEVIEEEVKKAPTEHDEMQWRLIHLGIKSNFEVWVPKNDQNKSYKGKKFKDYVIKEFREAIDVPSYVKNIDTVWKLNYSVKAAFEIEHSTAIYSGILRLSDLRALAPNSNYPLFIVADKAKKRKVFEQLQRPTFSSEYLNLDKVVKFLSYDGIRKLDAEVREDSVGFEIDWLTTKAEAPS